MSNKIIVGKSLSKFDWYEKLDVHSKMYARNAIKEIVEAVIDEIAREAKVKFDGLHAGMFREYYHVDKKSILNVKKMIDYE